MNGILFLWLPIVLFSGLAGAGAVGFLLGRRLEERDRIGLAPLFGVVEGSVLGLVGLILGFSFSLAVSRFDVRQRLVVSEANAIGTTYLRSFFLDDRRRTEFQDVLRAYAKGRILLYTHYRDAQYRNDTSASSAALQDRLWTIAIGASGGRPQALPLSLLVQTLNDTIDLSSEQTAALTNTVPAEVLALLVFVSVVATALMGYGFGLSNTRQPGISLLFALLMTAVVYTILDLDRPQQGFIKVNLGPLVAQSDSMH